jgi:purine-binding chemotaxis protein CheW
MSRQLITFQIGDQILGVDIMAIREIRAWSPATPLPNVPAHVRGVVNLRGVVLPVLDLSHRLGWGLTSPSARHVIIVVRIGDQLQGLIVDAVNDIVTVPDDGMQPLPDIGDNAAASFLEGLATIDQRLILVLALERLIDAVALTPSSSLAEAA